VLESRRRMKKEKENKYSVKNNTITLVKGFPFMLKFIMNGFLIIVIIVLQLVIPLVNVSGYITIIMLPKRLLRNKQRMLIRVRHLLLRSALFFTRLGSIRLHYLMLLCNHQDATKLL